MIHYFLFIFHLKIFEQLGYKLIFLLKSHKVLLTIIKEATYTDEKLTMTIIMNTSCIQIAALLKFFS